MVINEKALVQQMKEAYKRGGYTVIVRPYGRTVICSTSWAIEIDSANVPREALSLMALHMGFLPEEKEAYKIFKGGKEPTVQKTIFETAMEPIRKLEILTAETLENMPNPVKKTRLTFDGWNVWQEIGTQRIILIDPAYERIFYKKDKVIITGDAIYKEGSVSKAYVMRATAEKHENQLAHLGQIPWVAK